MPVKAIGSIIPTKSRVLTKKTEDALPKAKHNSFINSFEFQAGFTPTKTNLGHHKNDPVKVQHFIDSIV